MEVLPAADAAGFGETQWTWGNESINRRPGAGSRWLPCRGTPEKQDVSLRSYYLRQTRSGTEAMAHPGVMLVRSSSLWDEITFTTSICWKLCTTLLKFNCIWREGL